MNQMDVVSLGNLARGSCVERFDDEFKRVLENILDPNTADGARSITLKVSILPNEERSSAAVSISVDSSVKGPRPVPTMIFIGKDRGQALAFEHNPEQMKLNLTQKTRVHVMPVDTGGKGE